ncbi:CHAD domain-containing protein [Rhizobium sp. CAU 1783]
MPYRIDPAHPFDEEVRRVATEQLRSAIASLEQQPRGLHEAVHDARKNFKRLRALYRLVLVDDAELFADENARLRDTARTLSLVRDATAMVETVTYLEGHALNEDEARACAHARGTLTARRDALALQEMDLPQKAGGAVEDCHEAIAAIATLRLPKRQHKTARLLAKGWKRILQNARIALRECHDNAHEEVFHDLRKASQTYWRALSLLRDIWPSAMRAKRAEARSLTEILGHEHDLALLTDLLDSEPALADGSETFSHLLGAIIRQQQQLRRDALELADRVFADKPGREATVIEALWIEAALA